MHVCRYPGSALVDLALQGCTLGLLPAVVRLMPAAGLHSCSMHAEAQILALSCTGFCMCETWYQPSGPSKSERLMPSLKILLRGMHSAFNVTLALSISQHVPIMIPACLFWLLDCQAEHWPQFRVCLVAWSLKESC